MVECVEKSGHIEDIRNSIEEMNNKDAIKIIENEMACVERGNHCNRNCAKCDLVMEDTTIINAYNKAIHALINITKYRKTAKRFKRKYVSLKLMLKKALNEIEYAADADAYNDYQLGTVYGLVMAFNILEKNLKEELK